MPTPLRIASIFFLIALLSACTQPDVTPTQPAVSDPEQQILPKIDYAWVLSEIYPDPHLVVSEDLGLDSYISDPTIKWTSVNGLQTACDISVAEGLFPEKDWCAYVVFNHDYVENGIPYKMVLTAATLEDCTTCPTDLSISLFEYDTQIEDWSMVLVEPDFSSAGTFGMPPMSQTLRLGPNHYGLQILDRVTSAGVTYETTYIYEFGPDLFEEVLSFESVIQFHEEGLGFETEIRVVEENGRDRFDLEMIKRGTQIDEETSATEPFEEIESYTWDGFEYVLTDR